MQKAQEIAKEIAKLEQQKQTDGSKDQQAKQIAQLKKGCKAAKDADDLQKVQEISKEIAKLEQQQTDSIQKGMVQDSGLFCSTPIRVEPLSNTRGHRQENYVPFRKGPAE